MCPLHMFQPKLFSCLTPWQSRCKSMIMLALPRECNLVMPWGSGLDCIPEGFRHVFLKGFLLGSGFHEVCCFLVGTNSSKMFKMLRYCKIQKFFKRDRGPGLFAMDKIYTMTSADLGDISNPCIALQNKMLFSSVRWGQWTLDHSDHW